MSPRFLLPIFITAALSFLLPVTALAQSAAQYRSAAHQGIASPELNAGVRPSFPAPPQLTVSPPHHLIGEAQTPQIPEPYHVAGMTYVVTNTNGSGDGSLTKAINDANGNPGKDLISFSIPGMGVQTIALTSALPIITDPVIIDGATQPGYAGKPIIEINGEGVEAGHNGLRIMAGSSVVRGLVINRFVGNGTDNGFGIVLDSLGGNVVEGCYIGLNAAGTAALGNTGSGVGIFGGSSGNLIGGLAITQRNVISGNGVTGIQVSTGAVGGNRIINNYIGLSASGDSVLGNGGNGIYIDAANDTIGGTDPLTWNFISGNLMPGIVLDRHATGAIVQGNSFGTDRNAWAAFGNGSNGICVLGATNNVIGGTEAAARNEIYASSQAGIILSDSAAGNIVQGNYIGPTGNYTGNNIGIWVRDASGNTIGGLADSAGNLVTECTMYGIEISGPTSHGNVVQGNRIGGYFYPLSGYGNAEYGLVINNAPENIIGGSDPNATNIIQGNHKGGIIIAGASARGNIVQGNVIGPDINRAKGNGVQPDGIILAASGNRIGGNLPNEGNLIAYNTGTGIFDSTGSQNGFIGNLIYSNGRLGIDLGNRGITPNDSLDSDTGANDLQNFPILDSAVVGPGWIRIRGRMYGVPGAQYELEFFTNEQPTLLHFGQGQHYLGEGSVVCGAAGMGDITVTIAAAVNPSDIITATATSPDTSTSEFSRELGLLDSDGDGIMDLWETPGNGIDWNCDGVIDLDLVRKGANKNHKDIFVEVDHMVGSMPDYQSLEDVETAFRAVKNSYLNNPDGNNGVNLIIELDAGSVAIPHAVWGTDPWPEFLAVKKTHFGTDAERADSNGRNIIEAKRLVYRYCIFADSFGVASNAGKSRISFGGDVTNDFFVSLGGFDAYMSDPATRIMLESGTFMHELGHTLGLRHGGGDGIGYKPNYYSVMNYLFNWNVQDRAMGVVLPKDTWKLDFSPVALRSLDENHLDEFLGFDAPPNVYDRVLIPYNRPNGADALAVLNPATSVDWDGDGDSTSFANGIGDLNYLLPSMTPSPGERLDGYADWPNLNYNFRTSQTFPAGCSVSSHSGDDIFILAKTTDEVIEEIGLSEFLALKQLPPYGIIERQSNWSQSSLENIPVCTRSTWNSNPHIISDGHRGAIISWFHNEPSTSPLYDTRGGYAQRIDSLGRIHWLNNGVWFSLGRAVEAAHAIAADGEGGAIIAWLDLVNPSIWNSPMNLYAQRIDVDGNLLWGEGGIPISTNNTSYGGEPMIVPDGCGGAVVAWGTTTGTIRAQRVNGAGVPLWATEGIQVGTYSYPYSWWSDAGSSLAHDIGTGTVIVWHSGASNPEVRAQRIDTSGTACWGVNGIQLSSTGNFAFVVPAGEGETFVTWTDFRGGTASIYAQRLSTAGAFLWGAAGLAVDASTRNKFNPRLIADGRGGAVVAWFDTDPPLTGIRGQKITGAGALAWGAAGVSFADSSSDASGPFGLVSDLKGGAVVVYPSQMLSPSTDIFARHIDSAGAAVWNGSGSAVATAPFTQNFVEAVSDGAGGVITAWEDKRTGQSSPGTVSCIFAQLVNRRGGLGGNLPTGVTEQPAEVPTLFHLYQNYPNPFNPATTIEYDLPAQSHVVLRVYDILGRLVQELKNDIEPAGRAQYVWNPQNRLASGVYFCRIEVIGLRPASSSQMRVVKMMLLK